MNTVATFVFGDITSCISRLHNLHQSFAGVVNGNNSNTDPDEKGFAIPNKPKLMH
jgi:hypothetical protein